MLDFRNLYAFHQSVHIICEEWLVLWVKEIRKVGGGGRIRISKNVHRITRKAAGQKERAAFKLTSRSQELEIFTPWIQTGSRLRQTSEINNKSCQHCMDSYLSFYFIWTGDKKFACSVVRSLQKPVCSQAK